MIFNALPFEIKEHIFLYVSPNDWIDTAKVSQEWLQLTFGSIKAVQSHHMLILDYLAEFINQQRNTNYTWVSLVAMMPKLERLECYEDTEAFWNQISPICDQLKVLHCQPMNTVPFGWNQLNLCFKNLTELIWYGSFERDAFPLDLYELAPKLEKITVKHVNVTADWQKKIPKNVKHILLDKVVFEDQHQFYTNFVCEDPSTVESFCVVRGTLLENTASPSEFDGTRHLKKLDLSIDTFMHDTPPSTSLILRNAFSKCPRLETVKAYGVTITDSWRRTIPENVKSLYFRQLQVKEDIRSDFSYDWLFKNYGCLHTLHVEQESWTQFNAERFCSSENLRELILDNTGTSAYPFENNVPIDPFSDICAHMVRTSRLVDVTLKLPVINESWRHIFPPTIKRLNLEYFSLSNETRLVFSPQFICENPSNIDILSMQYNYYDELPAMDSSAFSEMNKLRKLRLIYSSVSGGCLESILANCFALTDFVVRGFQAGAINDVSSTLSLSSLRNLRVRETVDQPSKLCKHFPKLRTVHIPIIATEECCRDFIDGLRGMETAEITIMKPPWKQLRSLVENIDDAKFRYFCLSHGYEGFSFYLTNSLVYACRKLYCFTFQVNDRVLWIKGYPTSHLLRSRTESLPSSIDELLKRCGEVISLEDN